ncbi:MAG: hypothetical protein ABSF25_07355 [Bryobacteraceae bacterium]
MTSSLPGLILTLRRRVKGAQRGQARASFPRLIPALRPRAPAGEARPDWVDGFTGEAFMRGMAFGMAAFTLTLRLVYWYVIAGAGFAVYAVQAVRRSAR